MGKWRFRFWGWEVIGGNIMVKIEVLFKGKLRHFEHKKYSLNG
jgi:hypothetical protein